ncbi:DUF5667 domain-containing protein [Blastococcus sp. VKM Ac-2987]|uniref:DUF5667 domain-containing protein n=1 Tax=Blastococcus sp. VKM Ac-2987 TaxID=3004141 RepID=UPI0022AB6273|nr:DUF5667 domain-containing protein [Blastococcus sp. VKM Ac-2987]MCZ2859327.1 DUF5667 domain-containing protein [Blastococcus sp. VKM Ac-2987]
MLRHDDGSTLTGPPAAPGPEAALVARLEQLSAHLDTGPDPQYRARARARLVAMAAVRTPEPAPRTLRDRLLAAQAVDRPPSRWRGRITAALAGTAVAATGLAALVAVAAGAEPGDALYDLKRGTEQTQLALAGDSRGQTLLELAGTRLEELGLITGEGDATLVVRTLATMDRHTTEGAAWLTRRAVGTQDTGPLEALAGWTAEQSAGLTALEAAVPAGAELAFGRSADLLGALTVRAEGLQAALGCATGLATAGDDALGPVPGRCPADSPAEVAEAPARPGTDVVTDAGPGLPPSAGPADPASPAVPAPSSAPVGTPPSTPPGTARVPGPGSVPTEVPVPRQDGGLLPPLPTLRLPGGAGATGTPPPPVVAVPLPGPGRVCLPPPAAIGDC